MPSSCSSLPRFEYTALIVSSSGDAVLLVREGTCWSLPSWESADRQFWQSTAHVNRTLTERCGIAVTTLRCAALQLLPDDGLRLLYELECHDGPDTLPADARWFALADLADPSLSSIPYRAEVDRWVAERTGCVPALRPDWARPGWHVAMLAGVDAALARCGRSRTAGIEQLRTWGRSTVLRIRTNQGDVYLKAVPPMFAHELTLAEWLADHVPDQSPELLSIDHERLWILMTPYEGAALETVDDVRHWEGAWRAFAKLQRQLAPWAGDLLALGLPHRPLARLEHEIDGLLARDDLLMTGRTGGLTPDETTRLRGHAPILAALARELATFDIPLTIEHGDLHPGNVIVTPAGYLFFDWSDAGVAHPFFAAVLQYEDSDGVLPRSNEVRDKLRDAYLEPWLGCESRDRLLRAWDMSQVLAPVQYALLYQHEVLPGLELRWEMERMIPHYLRTALRRLDAASQPFPSS